MTSVTHEHVSDAAQVVTQSVRDLFTKQVVLKIVLLTLAFVFFFWDFLYRQVVISLEDPDWSHSLLIPVISVYFIYARRQKLAAIHYRTFLPGILFVIAGMAGYVFFTLGPTYNHTLQGGMMVLALFGVVLTMLGVSAMRIFLLPVAYLLLGIKIGDRAMFYATTQLKLIAAKGAWILLNLTGVDTEQGGSVLTLTKNDGTQIPLDVAEACSGMRMIVAFVALGVAIAFISCKRPWQRVVLVALAVPVAVFVNILRVATMGWLSLYDPNLAGGDIHILVGVLWLLPALAMYMGLVWVLNRIVITEPIRSMTEEEASH